jgi:hypothetical protein
MLGSRARAIPQAPVAAEFSGFISLMNVRMSGAPETTAPNVPSIDTAIDTRSNSFVGIRSTSPDEIAAAIMRSITAPAAITVPLALPISSTTMTPAMTAATTPTTTSSTNSTLLENSLPITQTITNDYPTGTALPAWSRVVPQPSQAQSPLAFGLQLTSLTAPKAGLNQGVALPGQETTEQAQAIQGLPTQSIAGQKNPAGTCDARFEAASSTDSQQPGLVRSQIKAKPETDREEPMPRVAATAAAEHAAFTGSFSSFSHTGNPFATASDFRHSESQATPFNSTADSIRTAEPSQPETVAHTSPLQEITVRVSQPNAPVVDLHLAERGGKIQVAVRTSDVTLQNSLRQDLGTLVSSLHRAGYHSEAVIPQESGTVQTQQAAMNSHDDRESSHSGSSHGGSGHGGSGDSQQNPRRGRREAWLQEMEKSK